MRASSFFVVGLLALLHCGEDSSGNQGTSNQAISVNENNFNQVFLDTLCKNYGSCCTKAGYQFDGLSCTLNATFFVVPLFQPTNTTWNQANAEACIAKTQAKVAACEDDILAIPECARVRESPVEVGKPCALSTECKLTTGQSTVCRPSEDGGDRVCWQDTKVEIGEACGDDKATFTERTCASKHGKVISCVSGICEEQPPACSGPCKADGEACSGAQDCANNTCVRGVCGPLTTPSLLCKP